MAVAKKVKTVGSRASVYHGNALKTSGGLTKKDLKMNSNGSIVSRKNSARAKRKESPLLKLWRQSVKKTYQQPKYKGKFCVIKKGSSFYKAVKKEYAARLKKAGYTSSGKKTTKKRVKKKA